MQIGSQHLSLTFKIVKYRPVCISTLHIMCMKLRDHDVHEIMMCFCKLFCIYISLYIYFGQETENPENQQTDRQSETGLSSHFQLFLCS